MSTMQPLQKCNDFVIKFANVNGTGSASANELFARAVIVSSLVFEPSVVVRLAEIVALSAFLAWRCRFVSGLTLNPATGRDRDR